MDSGAIWHSVYRIAAAPSFRGAEVPWPSISG
jgi:hypothetical protein